MFQREIKTVHSEFTDGFEEERVVVKVILDKPNISLTLFSSTLDQDIQSPLHKCLDIDVGQREENQHLHRCQPTRLPLHPEILPKCCYLARILTTLDGPCHLAHNRPHLYGTRHYQGFLASSIALTDRPEMVWRR